MGEGYEPVSRLPRGLPLSRVAPGGVTRSLLTDNTPGIGMAPDAARHLATHYGSLAFDVA